MEFRSNQYYANERRLRCVTAAHPIIRIRTHNLRVLCEHLHPPDAEAEGEAEIEASAGRAHGANKRSLC